MSTLSVTGNKIKIIFPDGSEQHCNKPVSFGPQRGKTFDDLVQSELERLQKRADKYFPAEFSEPLTTFYEAYEQSFMDLCGLKPINETPKPKEPWREEPIGLNKKVKQEELERKERKEKTQVIPEIVELEPEPEFMDIQLDDELIEEKSVVETKSFSNIPPAQASQPFFGKDFLEYFDSQVFVKGTYNRSKASKVIRDLTKGWSIADKTTFIDSLGGLDPSIDRGKTQFTRGTTTADVIALSFFRDKLSEDDISKVKVTYVDQNVAEKKAAVIEDKQKTIKKAETNLETTKQVLSGEKDIPGEQAESITQKIRDTKRKMDSVSDTREKKVYGDMIVKQLTKLDKLAESSRVRKAKSQLLEEFKTKQEKPKTETVISVIQPEVPDTSEPEFVIDVPTENDFDDVEIELDPELLAMIDDIEGEEMEGLDISSAKIDFASKRELPALGETIDLLGGKIDLIPLKVLILSLDEMYKLGVPQPSELYQRLRSMVPLNIEPGREITDVLNNQLVANAFDDWNEFNTDLYWREVFGEGYDTRDDSRTYKSKRNMLRVAAKFTNQMRKEFREQPGILSVEEEPIDVPHRDPFENVLINASQEDLFETQYSGWKGRLPKIDIEEVKPSIFRGIGRWILKDRLNQDRDSFDMVHVTDIGEITSERIERIMDILRSRYFDYASDNKCFFDRRDIGWILQGDEVAYRSYSRVVNDFNDQEEPEAFYQQSGNVGPDQVFGDNVQESLAWVHGNEDIKQFLQGLQVALDHSKQVVNPKSPIQSMPVKQGGKTTTIDVGGKYTQNCVQMSLQEDFIRAIAERDIPDKKGVKEEVNSIGNKIKKLNDTQVSIAVAGANKAYERNIQPIDLPRTGISKKKTLLKSEKRLQSGIMRSAKSQFVPVEAEGKRLFARKVDDTSGEFSDPHNTGVKRPAEFSDVTKEIERRIWKQDPVEPSPLSEKIKRIQKTQKQEKTKEEGFIE